MEQIFSSILLQNITIFSLGLVLGLKHAFDADHISAVSTLVSQTKSLKKSSLLGVFWGVGHTTTLLIAGFLIIFFKLAIPERVSISFELFIGIILIFLGLNVFYKIKKEKAHFHAHAHEGGEHIHLHCHLKAPTHNHTHSSFILGMIHGLAGSAALMLFVLATIPSLVQGLFYILIFGIGSTLGMLAVSSLIGMPFLFIKRFPAIDRVVKLTAGALSIAIGTSMIYEIGIMRIIF